MRLNAAHLSVIIAAGISLAISSPVRADWISDKLSDSCSSASANTLSKSVRDNIEDSMKRAEASIKPPSPVGDMGCLDDLMSNVGINIFSEDQAFGGSMASGIVSQLMGSLGDQLGSAGLGDILNASGDPMGAVCKFAEEKWGELTGGLGGGNGMKLPPDLSQAFNLGNFNLPGANARSASAAAPDPTSPIAPQATSTTDTAGEDAINQLWRDMAAPAN